MSKIFSAKRREMTATYEFLDGRQVPFTIVSLTTNEQKELSVLQKDSKTTLGDLVETQSRMMMQRTEASLREEIMSEQMSEGNILDFSRALASAIEEAAKKKSND